ncbi:hypothetical protein BST97_00985 [Nonlabens spongiae]|uniref:Secretion system C-terminal sorting domain-containing protein n=1 Tax=Nonlabens spongiae TaxID=331648 RepID=A0A1W6MGF9_9FLAO|nr:T9SS type A sorting domain-containing protein [Nonlabens spongiae]ARN76691.1 hypothetical protein BST97_00985 [Nonlabens spongiae]
MRFLLTINRFCFLVLFLASSVGWSQSVDRELTSSAADSFINGGNLFEITVGDVAVTDLGANPAINQGFLQNANTIYIYSGGSWSPMDPVGNATDKDFVIVEDGSTTLTGNLIAQDLTIDPGATLDFGSNDVSISERLINNGTVLGGDARLIFTGSTGEFTGNNIEVSNFENNGSGTLSLELDLSVYDLVTLNSGTVDNNSGKLIFKSGPVKTAMLNQVSISNAMTGSVQVERYYQDTRAFRFISSPVTTTSSINSNWQEGVNNTSLDYSQNQNPNPGFGTHISGNFTGVNGFDATQNGNPSLFGFDNIGQAWTVVSNTNSQTLSAGNPYRLFIRGDRSINLNFNASTPTETRVRAEGELAFGNFVESNLNTGAGAFNFVGNPYQAAVDMNTVLGASTNLNTNSFYVWDPNLQSGVGAYVTVALPAGTNTSASTANQYLQPSQGAFVTTLNAGAASIVFNESDKAVGQNTSVYNTSNGIHSIVGQIFKNNAGVLGQYPEDSFGIDFHETYSNDINAMDAIKPFNVRENIYVNNSGVNLSLERRELPADNEEIHVDHSGYSVSEYTYRVYVTGLVAHDVFLRDDLSNQLVALSQGLNEYQFSVDPNDASGAIDRFSFVFQDTTLSNPTIDSGALEIALYPNPINGDVLNIDLGNLDNSSNQYDLSFRVSTILGQQIMSDALNVSNGQASVTGLGTLSTGTYLFEIYDGKDRLYTDKIIIE